MRSASAGPPIWFAALIFATPTSGISTWRSRGIDRNASRRFPGSVRMSMIESDRLAPRARRSGAVGAEHEDRGRVRDEQPVGRRELAADAGRHASVRLRDAARDGEVARDAQATTSATKSEQAEHDPALLPPRVVAARPRRRRGRAPAPPSAGRRGVASEWHPPLDPAAPVDPVRLVLSGHEAGYGSRAVAADRVIGVDVGGTKILAGPRARRHRRPDDRGADAHVEPGGVPRRARGAARELLDGAGRSASACR